MNYKSYRKEVKTYMKKLEKQLKAEYGCIPDEWEISFKMLADNYQMYFDIMDQIKQDGLMPEKVTMTTKGPVSTKDKNPLFPALFNCQTNINRIVNQFAGTIMSKSKIKMQPNINDENDDYLNSL